MVQVGPSLARSRSPRKRVTVIAAARGGVDDGRGSRARPRVPHRACTAARSRWPSPRSESHGEDHTAPAQRDHARTLTATGPPVSPASSRTGVGADERERAEDQGDNDHGDRDGRHQRNVTSVPHARQEPP